MSFEAELAALHQKLPMVVNDLETEESTKNALIMPFIKALGSDVFDPKEVAPEFVADVGIKKGEKVDYAIKRDGEVIILMECKPVRADLGKSEIGQLVRYFHVTKARIGVLTNGVRYLFFSDLDEANKMDERPFLELDLSEPRVRPEIVAQVKKLAKEHFDLAQILGVANELKAISECKKLLARQLDRPEEDFVKFLWSRCTTAGSKFTSAARERYSDLVGRAFREFINDEVDRRLEGAIKKREPEAAGPVTPDQPSVKAEEGIVTTEEEMEGFRIVRAIACQVVRAGRVVYRDNKSYCAVLLDDNNRKPICRLWFNGAQKYVGTFSADRQETKIPIQDISDIYLHSDTLLQTIRNYESSGKGS